MDTFLNKWRLCIVEALLNVSPAFQGWLTHKRLSSLTKIRTEPKERTKSLMLILGLNAFITQFAKKKVVIVLSTLCFCKRGWSGALFIEHLPCMYEVPGSVPSIA